MTATDGTIIYHPDSSLIQKSLKNIDISSNVTNLVTSDKNGFVKFKVSGSTKYGYVTAIDNTGYVVFSSLSSGEYSQSLVRMIIIMIVIFVIGIVIIFAAIVRVSGSITKPIESLDVAAKELADGNLDVHLEVTTNDEIGTLGRSIQLTVQRLKVYIAYIDEVADVLEKMADGTLAIHLKQEYTGDFNRIKDALLNISASMTDIMTGISESSNQVSAGSDDLARAGEAGRGFAVVASEISSLAAQSSGAATTSKELIGVSIDEIAKGVDIANEVTDILQTVVNNIAQAVQDTSATAQESSATSEELAAQAAVLSDLIKKFDLSK